MPDYQSLNIMMVGSALLFVVGCLGFLMRQSLFTKLLCAGLMGQGILGSFIAISRFHNSPVGTPSGLMMLGLLLAEGILGLGLLLRLSAEEGAWVSGEEESAEHAEPGEDVQSFLIVEKSNPEKAMRPSPEKIGDQP